MNILSREKSDFGKKKKKSEGINTQTKYGQVNKRKEKLERKSLREKEWGWATDLDIHILDQNKSPWLWITFG